MKFQLGNWFSKTYVILNSRILLYIVLFLSIIDLYVFAVNGELLYVAISIIIGFLTAFFSKNMTVIFFMAMIFTNILRYGKDIQTKEGMTDASDMESAMIEKSTEPTSDDIKQIAMLKQPAKVESSSTVSDAADVKDTDKKSSSSSVDDISKKISGLDDDTLKLLQKQQKIIENMQNLEPLLKNAEGFLANFNR